MHRRILLNVRLFLAAFVCLILQSASYAQTPAVLQINRVAPKPGDEGKYQEILRERKELCVRVDCPPYLVLQPLAELPFSAAYKMGNPYMYDRKAVNELWQLTGFESIEERDRVAKYYRTLHPYLRQMPVAMTSTAWLNYHPDPNRGVAWGMDHSRFLVIVVTEDKPSTDGTIFENGIVQITVSSADSRAEAEEIATASRSQAVVFAVRRDLSLPAKSWIVADPDFWAKPTSEKDIRAVIDPDQMPQ